MASPKNSPKTVHLPQSMIDGEKFVKWDEDSVIGTPVTLKIDKYGFYLHWIDQNCESEVLDVAYLRDVRTGKQAKIPKDPKLRQVVTIGSADTLEEKTVTLVFGTDFVNLTFINFCCAKKEVAKLWTDALLKLVCNRAYANASALTFLLKAYTKLTLLLDRSGKIPVKSITKTFAQNKEERKRVEKALDLSGFPFNKNDALNPSSFSFDDFVTFYKNLTQRTEVEKIFDELCINNSKRKLLSIDQFVEFINKTQRDPRLNEILYPYANASHAKDLILEYEPNKYNAQKGQLSFNGFLMYLMSDDNPTITSSKLELTDDMDQPLAHYFINSSHNTYLTGHQLTGKSSVEMYRQCLLAGCRCVELDFWNGRTDEPVIVHGYTFVPEVSAREVIEAIADSAFKTSEYPVILSFENHCNPRQQAKIAQYCREYFGDMLLDIPLESHKLEPGVQLPSPSLLKRKIIIKNKKKHHHHHHHHHHHGKKGSKSVTPSEAAAISSVGNGEVHPHPPPVRQGSKDSSQENEYEEDEDEGSSTGIEDEEDENTLAEDMKLQMQGKPSADKVSTSKETEAGAEISALVNYVQPVHFTSFECAEKRSRYYEMSSFDEKQATTLLKEQPIEFVNYNKRQLSRVYPAGTRFDSSNFMPQVFWNAGCQLVAINYQTLDVAMQLNLGIFEYNQRCGYLLKPEFLRREDRRFDPFAESTVDGIIAGTVSIHVLSAQFLTDKKVGTYVEVDMYGLPTDTVRKKFKTKICPNNGINPVYDDEPFVFKKVVLPDLASIRIAAYEESGKLIGHRVLPVVGLCPGYRHIGLRNESRQSLPLATLFVHIVVRDYVPDGLSDFAEALANPIKFQSELDKRSKQLAVYMDENERIDNEDTASSMLMKVPSLSADVPPKPRMSCPDITTGNTLPVPVQPPRLSITPMFPTTGDSSSRPAAATDDGETSLKVPLMVGSESQSQSGDKRQKIVSPSLTFLSDELVAETLEKLMENKAVKEKKLELEKKLESLWRKYEKERKSHLQKVPHQDGEKVKTKLNVSTKLARRWTLKNPETFAATLVPHLATELSSECSESDGDAAAHSSSQLLRSHSEKLLSIYKSYVMKERELREKYNEMIFSALEKVMRNSQSNQMKTLRVLLEKETDAVMRRLETKRLEEVKILSKKHKDKDELVRMKREVAGNMVEKGVNERMRLTQIYEKRKEDLERQHQQIRNQLEEARLKEKSEIAKEFEEKSRKSIVEIVTMSDRTDTD